MFSWESLYKLQTLQMINFGVELGLFRLVAYSSLKIPIAEIGNSQLKSAFKHWPLKAERYATGTICCLDLKLNPCTVDPCIHQYHGGSTRRVRGTYWSTIGKQWKRTTVCFFPTITKGPGRDLNSLGGKFGVNHYQKIVPQNAEWKTFRLVKYLVSWPRLHVPFEGALNITRPRSLKTMVFPSFGSYMGNIPRKRPAFFSLQ